jgi:hypothetical protein
MSGRVNLAQARVRAGRIANLANRHITFVQNEAATRSDPAAPPSVIIQ